MADESGFKTCYLFILICMVWRISHAVTVNVRVGKDAILVCPLSGENPEWLGPPGGQTALTENGAFLKPEMTYSSNKDLNISAAQTVHTGEYRCRKNNGEGIVLLNVNKYDVNVTLHDTYDSSLNDSGGVLGGLENTDVEVLCTVEGGYPQPGVTFVISDSNTTTIIDAASVKITAEKTENNTFIVNATTTMKATRELDRKSITCNATFDETEEYTETTAVFYFTLVPEIFNETYNIQGDKKVFKCTSGNSRPGTNITWKINNDAISSPYISDVAGTACSEIPNLYRTYECSSVLTLGNFSKTENGDKVTCDIEFNGAIQDTSLEGHILSIPFPPTTVTITGNSPVKLDSSDGKHTLSLTCTTDTAYANETAKSGVTITWYNGQSEISSSGDLMYTPGDNNGFVTSQSLSLELNRTMNGNNIRCSAKNLENMVNPVESVVKLNVSYPPVLVEPISSQYRVYVGQTITVHCFVRSYPPSTFKWILVETPEKEMNITDAVADDNLCQLTFDSMSRDNAGTYRCEAENGVGSKAMKSIQILAYDPPSGPLFSRSGTESETSITLTLTTSSAVLDIHRTFYIQYRKYDAVNPGPWFELATPVPDTEVWQSSRDVTLNVNGLEEGTKYDVRIKSVNSYGMTSFSAAQSVSTKAGDTMVKKSDLNTAIIVAVFVTAAVFLAFIVIVILVTRRSCCSSRSAGMDLPLK